MANEEFIISCRNLVVGYGEEAVLSDVNLQIKPGSFLPFVGPNGVGKTTLLRTILGFLQPLAGELLHPFGLRPPGYVPQVSTLDRLYPVTAREVVCMGLYPRLGLWKKPDLTMNAEVDGYLERFNLSRHAHRPLEELSGGMRQKIMIARALVSGADVLIMDEPAAGLDEQSEFDLVRLLHQLAKQDGKTVLFAQHSIEPVIGLAEDVCHFSPGRIHLTPLLEFLDQRNLFLKQESQNVCH
ncbi:MAG: ATP-binding cassette domain-containing protein [Candidatus Riflebacteria bacterium]|jgi:ABC-type Mn2+/Zn2+ transport system ATPase subunit|nr:ATP-binding cassette domain-containing protein [Candidatus Riflebacteria bacterium]